MQQEDSPNPTPQTGNSTNMKTRARKSLEPVVYDLKDESPQVILKNVKKEKVNINTTT